MVFCQSCKAISPEFYNLLISNGMFDRIFCVEQLIRQVTILFHTDADVVRAIRKCHLVKRVVFIACNPKGALQNIVE